MARVEYDLIVQPPLAIPDAHCIEGMVAVAADFSVTDSAATTAIFYLGGLIPWRVINESGGAATLTFTDATSLTGTSLATFDEDGGAIPTMTIADDASEHCPPGLDGVTYLIVTGAAAGDHFTLVCRR